ncbi:ferredoxin-type protein NapG [Rhodocyclus purpureus]|uniref:ferredoxin-type protein NapG n=1 Tax=Rhodocyclus purpureus TaxID=1067 RepID=UPI0019116105|nr:ferredoxin-type protein NapG [Rhodocyclus purpureus]MBK5913655.1 ferredoxin-type protein NapG [Rhodocyclus purpureus]
MDDSKQSATKAPALPRRKFLGQVSGAACAAGLIALGVGLHARQARALPAVALRPPGALPEDDFLAACIRCGLCVRDCPYDTLRLADLGENVVAGTPYFEARQIPCEMCTDIPCVKACPSGALDPALKDIDRARMGLAVLIDHESCLNFLGLRCDVCYRVCPAIDRAITLEHRHNPRSDRHAMLLPTVHSDACTGCGKCEKSCVLEVAAIKVLPIKLAKGAIGEHYRLGWEEKEKAGGSLISPQLEMATRLPGAPADSPAASPAPAGADSLREGF